MLVEKIVQNVNKANTNSDISGLKKYPIVSIHNNWDNSFSEAQRHDNTVKNLHTANLYMTITTLQRWFFIQHFMFLSAIVKTTSIQNSLQWWFRYNDAFFNQQNVYFSKKLLPYNNIKTKQWFHWVTFFS